MSEPTRRNFYWISIQFLLRLVFTVWLRYRAYGIERLPESGGGLLLINHQSFLDPLLVGLPLRRPISYIARENLLRVPVVGWILQKTYVTPINRDAAASSSIRAAVDRLNEGFLVGVFPEGTRSDGSEVAPLKPGFVSLVRRARVPVIPVGLAGADEALPQKGWFLRPRIVRVVFGEPLSEDDVRRLTARGQEEQFAEFAREKIVECQRQAEARRRGMGLNFNWRRNRCQNGS